MAAQKGSITQQSPGVWVLRVGAGVDPVLTEERRKQGKGPAYRTERRVIRGTRRDAETALRRLVVEVRGHGHAGRTDADVDWLLAEWMAHLRDVKGVSPKTLDTYAGIARKNVAPLLGKIPLSRLSAKDLDRFYAVLGRQDLSPATVRKHHTMLSAALSQAVKWDLVDRNVAKLASPPPVPSADPRPPTRDEVAALLDAAEKQDPSFGVLIWLAAVTGARRGELCGLRWSRVDLERRSLEIVESIIEVGDEVIVKAPKTRRSKRRVALDDVTVALLARWRADQRARAAEAGVRLVADPFVCSQRFDGAVPWRPTRVSGTFGRVRKRLGLPHVHLHSLRSWMISESLSRGVDVRTVAGRVGHADGGRVTLSTYAGFLPEPDRRAADLMGELVRAPDDKNAPTR